MTQRFFWLGQQFQFPPCFILGNKPLPARKGASVLFSSQFSAGCSPPKSSLRLQTWIFCPSSLHCDKLVQGGFQPQSWALALPRPVVIWDGSIQPQHQVGYFSPSLHEMQTPCTCVEPSGTRAAAGTHRGSQLSSPELPTCSKKNPSQALSSQQEYLCAMGKGKHNKKSQRKA